MKKIEYNGYGVDIRDVIDYIYLIQPNFPEHITDDLEINLKNMGFLEALDVEVEPKTYMSTICIDVIDPINTKNFETLLLISGIVRPDNTLSLLTKAQANIALTRAIAHLIEEPLTEIKLKTIQTAVELSAGTHYDKNWTDNVRINVKG